jgi:nucleoid DNA-binding protein
VAAGVAGLRRLLGADPKGREARNPRTGEKVMVPEKKVVGFKAGNAMKEPIEGTLGTSAS